MTAITDHHGYPIVVDDVERVDLHYDGLIVPLHTPDFSPWRKVARVAISPPSWFSRVRLFFDRGREPKQRLSQGSSLHVVATDGQRWEFHDVRGPLLISGIRYSYDSMTYTGCPWLRRRSARACPDCNGTGMYVGFTATEKCRSCS